MIRNFRSTPFLATTLILAAVGCKSGPPPVSDAALSRTIQTQISTDGALNGQVIQTAVVNGVATLDGSVQNDAQKVIAARDAAGVAGVKEVRNNLNVNIMATANLANGNTPAGSSAVSASVTVPPSAPIPVPIAPTPKVVKPVAPEPAPRRVPPPPPPTPRQPAPIERPEQTYNPPPQPEPIAPPAPAQPAFKTVTVATGDSIPVRITQTLDSATTQEGSTFSGVVASDIVIDGVVAIPAGAVVSGHVDTVHEAAHFKGSSLLTISISSIIRRGDRIAVSSDPYTVQGKGRGKNTAEKIGGGAAVGAILGGIFGGGKGAAIGAAAGGGVGAGANAVTKGQQVQIESETVVRFHLSAPITVRVRADR